MPIVTMPDGTPVSFPDEMPPAQIKQMILQKFPSAGQPQMGVGEDVARSVIQSGTPKGLSNLIGGGGDVYNLMQTGVDKAYEFGREQIMGPRTPEQQSARQADMQTLQTDFTGENVRKAYEDVAGPIYEPKTSLGKKASEATEWALGSAIGPGGKANALRRTIAGGAGGWAYETAKQSEYMDGVPDIVPLIIGIGVSGGVGVAEATARKSVRGNKAFEKAYEAAPTFKDLKQTSRDWFANARLKNKVALDNSEVGKFSDNIKQTLYEAGQDIDNAPITNKTLDEIKALTARIAPGVNGGPSRRIDMSFNDLLNKRNKLSQAASGVNAQGKATPEAAAAMEALSAVDDGIFSGRWAKSSSGGKLTREAQQELQKAREIWRRASIAQDMESLGYKAKLRGKVNYTQAGEDTAIRRRVATYLTSPSRSKYLNDQERKAMEGLVMGDRYTDKLRDVGRSGSAGSITSQSNVIAGGGAGVLANQVFNADPQTAALIGGATWAGKSLAGKAAKSSLDRLTKQKLQNLDLMIRSGKTPPQQRQEISRQILKDAMIGGVQGGTLGTRTD